MKNLAKSSFIFDLIDEYQIFTTKSVVNALTDEGFNSFCDKYKTESVKRDSELFQYVITTPNFFRCHLPYSKWTLSVAFNVVWYYDELIINDPILSLINSPLPNIEQNKYRLQELLSFIIKFRESIQGGYVLFAGDHIIPSRTGQFENTSEELLKDEQVLDWFEQFTLLGQKPSPINEDLNDNLTQLLAKYEGMWGENHAMGVYIPSHVMNSEKLANGVMYDLVSPYKRLTKEELISFNKLDMLVGLQKEYVKDISVVLETLTNAHRLNAPVLFYREVDRVVAQQYAFKHSTTGNLIANTSVYNCSLPYMEGIPTERLFDTRTQMPEVFKEFRAFLYELVSKTMKATDNPAEIKFKIDNEITSMQRKLKVEMNNAQRKWRVHGVAAPILVGLGSMSLFSSGINYSELISTLLGTGGAISSLKTWSDVKSEEKKAEINPVYFLWKAKGESH